MQSELYIQYQEKIKAALGKELGIKNPTQIPAIDKVCINVGIGSYLQRLGSKDPSFVVDNIEAITGRKAVVRNAKLSVSNFKLRKGMPVGVSVTLRRQEAYDFLYKLVNVVYPRVRDFRGVGRTIFDTEGNCSFGFKDHTVFPEVGIPEDSRKVHGIEVTVVTTTKNPEHTEKLLEAFGFPLKKLNTPSS